MRVTFKISEETLDIIAWFAIQRPGLDLHKTLERIVKTALIQTEGSPTVEHCEGCYQELLSLKGGGG